MNRVTGDKFVRKSRRWMGGDGLGKEGQEAWHGGGSAWYTLWEHQEASFG